MNAGGESLVVVPFGVQVLALTAPEFQKGLERGRGLTGGTASAAPSGANGDAPEHLLTAQEMEARTTVRATWYLEAARRGELPHYRVGRYIRFSFGEVRACARFRGRTAD